MTIYRPHKGSLTESLAAAVDFNTKDDLVSLINVGLEKWGFTVASDDIRIEPYGTDDRIGWDTQIVLMKNIEGALNRRYFGQHMPPDYFGCIGFTNRPL